MNELDVHLLTSDQDGTSGAPAATLRLAPGASQRLEDILGTFGHHGTAAIRLVAHRGVVVASSRTYTSGARGTRGQLVPALPESCAASGNQPVVVTGLAHGGGAVHGSRTNIGWVNLSHDPLTMRIEVLRADGASVGSRTVVVPALSHHQENGLIGRLTGLEVVNGTAVLTAEEAGAAYMAYASVVENHSGDPVFILGQTAAPLVGGRPILDR
jgi:hypothetical protein